MGIIEVNPQKNELTLTQRWAHSLTILTALVIFAFGLNLRQGTLNATVTYSDVRAGIDAIYPERWLLDTDSDDYVFRIRNMTRRGFKTVIQISIRPVSPETTPQNIITRLALTRGQTLTDYDIRSSFAFTLREPDDAQATSYTFVSTETNPLLEGIPSVVRGLDIITITRGQAIIITFRAEADVYDEEYQIFQQFLRDLDY